MPEELASQLQPLKDILAALGYTIAIVILASIRERIEGNDIPKYFQGMPMVLITSCLMAIAFTGFSGMVSL